MTRGIDNALSFQLGCGWALGRDVHDFSLEPTIRRLLCFKAWFVRDPLFVGVPRERWHELSDVRLELPREEGAQVEMM